jgi:serine/threonine protein kinase/tetratricopeptide (TPR) repeat protein
MVDSHHIKRVFDDAADLPRVERRAFLEQACGGNAELRKEVESLLRAMDEGSGFMAGARLDKALTCHAGTLAEGPGDFIGRYHLLQLIGEGGFGAVFMAEQREPVQRRVAVKVIKLGMDTKRVIGRFEAERQALAMMDHPNIARVLDAGATATGRPYFVMELVRGEPITAFCDREQLSIRQRLELFREVCSSVQHAHQKGIIHRDLKPSNILVNEIDGRPTPKIIDFGIAKATGGSGRVLTDKTLFTDFRQFIGTPEYMSPEQAGRGDVDIDTRSDIYSLGVLLYELVTGGPPFDPVSLRSAAWEEMRRVVREDEPPRPSTRLHALENTREIAARRGVDPARLVGMVRGDLDWIVMKCLEKDRARRYETANGLAMDLTRHLGGEPVVAAPPSRAYRLRKFVSRHRGPVAAGVAIAVVLVLGTIGTTVGMAWALREAGNARQAEAEADEVVDFLASQIAQLDVMQMGTSLRVDIESRLRAALELKEMDETAIDATVNELEQLLAPVNFTDVASTSIEANILQRTLQAIDARFADQPLVQARLFESVAESMRALDLRDEALEPQERALKIHRRVLGELRRETIASRVKVGSLYYELQRYEESEPMLRKAVEDARQALGRGDPLTLEAINELGVLLNELDKQAESERCFREVVRSGTTELGEEHQLVITAMGNLGGPIASQGRRAEALEQYRRAYEVRARVYGETDTSALWALTNVGTSLHELGRLDEAQECLEKALDLYRVVRGNEHPRTIQAMYNLAELYRDMGRLTDADAIGAESVRYARGINMWMRARPLYLSDLLADHARTLIAMERFGAAEEELHEAQGLLETESFPITSDNSMMTSNRHTARVYVDLYTAWSGHDEQAAAWTKRLEEIDGATPDDQPLDDAH